MEPDPKDVEALIREKYAGERGAVGVAADVARLAAGEPLAYVIGHVPFLGLSLDLFSRPLIPRPETEWWTEELINHLNDDMIYHIITEERGAIRILDLCAGSGAIGLAILNHCPGACVSFGELMEEHEAVIRKNIKDNGLDAARADIRIGDLFFPFTSTGVRAYAEEGLSEPEQHGNLRAEGQLRANLRRREGARLAAGETTRTPAGIYPNEAFDIIATNPPYVPSNRSLDESLAFEPSEALYAGVDGMDIIRHIAVEAASHMKPGGELWMECDIANIEKASELVIEGGATRTEIRIDQYGRPRLLVAYY